ncbi:MAG: hypothetical protein HEP71_30220 [Roseivirga sp.]|nr:hypothetical protein [Roseivirga sp.]
MKRITLSIVLLFMAVAVFAQDGQTTQPQQMKTLFGNSGIRSNGGYGAVSTGYTKIDGLDAITIGGKGAWLINHQIGIGLSGTGFLTERRFDTGLSDDYRFAGGYGGLMFEFIAAPNSPVHLSFSTTVGAGGVSYVRDNHIFDNFDRDPFDEDTEAFFVVEPGVELELNLLRFMRLGFGVSYRYTSDITLTYNANNQAVAGKDLLNGLSGGISLKFGKF